MYLANEGIYYELLSDKDYNDVWDFAREKSVFLTSPKNFELICSSLLLVIRRQELGQNIQQILMNLNQLEKDLSDLNQQFEKSYNQLKYSFFNLQEFEKILNRFIINYRNLLKSEEKLEQKIQERSLI
jgi:DNA anti-recombination protein RmuC